MTPLPAGTPAPDFELRSTAEEATSLSDLRGRPVVLVFYPADFSPTCTDQLGLYQMLLPEFERFDAVLLGISVDNLWAHKAFAADRNLQLPAAGRLRAQGRGVEGLRGLQRRGGERACGRCS